MSEQEIGVIKHYFDRVGAAVIEITAVGLAVGDQIHIKGHTTDVTTTVASLQFEHTAVQAAKVGDQVGTKVPQRVREHDKVFRVTP
jgi:hypothetical protein